MKKLFKDFNEKDVTMFYLLQNHYNVSSGIVGVISKTFKEMERYLKKKFPNHLIICNPKKKSIVVCQEDYLKSYIILDTIDDLVSSEYLFERYI